jgi:CubicO group peptidase (beta-lactamase class C family)
MRFSLYLAIFGILLLAGCRERDGLTGRSPDIAGIWKCTPETAEQYPQGTRETALLIERGPEMELTARGCFIFEGNYHHPWELEEIHYNDTTGLLSILDVDGDWYLAYFDPPAQTLSGHIHSLESGDPVPLDTLDFIRADDSLATRLFIPRLPGKDGNLSVSYAVPPSLNDGLNTASLFSCIRDTSAYEDLMKRIINQDFGRLESLLVLKDGQLVLEEYFFGYDRNRLHNIHSCTKSIASLLLGIVLEEYGNFDLNTPISSFFPGYDSLFTGGKEKITLEDLLTMHAGFASDLLPEKPGHGDQLQSILSLPLVSDAGETFQYDNSNSILLGAILLKITGIQADRIASQYLFNPLGISAVQWEKINGLPQCHSNLMMLPRDMAKIGQLVLNYGKWEERQIVPAAWVEKSTRPQVAESVFFDYGYHWWCRSAKNQPCWEDPDDRIGEHPDIALALGFAGQFIMVIRDLNMVVVTTASDYGDYSVALKKIQLAVEEILPLLPVS